MSKWWSSHGKYMTMQEFIDIEVMERDNYTYVEIRKQMDIYGIEFSTPVIWVTDRETCDKLYCRSPDGQELAYSPIKIKNVQIIKEITDGDNGFLAMKLG